MAYSQYASEAGPKTEDDVAMAVNRFGLNLFDIPLPTFQELFKEHAVAPFFVFQVFCVCLWFMDEYWYYSLFTLIMLFVFESTVVFQVRTSSPLKPIIIVDCCSV
jgi:cation-transporting ATPase 13A1